MKAKPDTVALRRAGARDARLVFDIRSGPDVRAASFDSAPLDVSAHEIWFARRLATPTPHLYIVEADGQGVGFCRLDVDEAEAASVSIALLPQWRGLDVARRGLEELRTIALADDRIECLVAYALPDNHGSLRAFQNAGYVGPMWRPAGSDGRNQPPRHAWRLELPLAGWRARASKPVTYAVLSRSGVLRARLKKRAGCFPGQLCLVEHRNELAHMFLGLVPPRYVFVADWSDGIPAEPLHVQTLIHFDAPDGERDADLIVDRMLLIALGERPERREFPEHRLLGIRVNALTHHDLLNEVIAPAIDKGTKLVVAHHNMHSLYLSDHDPKMRAFYECARYVYIDGMPIVALGRLLGLPLRREHRITLVDWLDPLLTMAVRHGWRVFILGGPQEVSTRAMEILARDYPGLQVLTENGFFDVAPSSDENEALLARLAAYRPNLLLVGMGMPRQEHWIVDNVDRLEANVIINVGAVMELVTGALPLPPRWMGPMGLEWLFRLVTQPRRTWRRYLQEPWPVARRFAREWAERRMRFRSRPPRGG